MNYYTLANTANGLIDFTEDNIFDLKTKIQLDCDNLFIRNLIFDSFKGIGENIIAPGSSCYKDGIIIRDKDIAVLSHCNNPTETLRIDFCTEFRYSDEEITCCIKICLNH